MCEILAPAGNAENLITAINYGADAIYLGLSDFSARKNAENFTIENLYYYISYAKIFNVKIYLAINTLIKDSEINLLNNIIVNAYNLGVDAFILQDIFLGKIIKEKYPEVTLHLSTQAGVNNIYGALVAKKFGFSRVILARETSLEEIAKITKIIETEVFIQGALCTSFSGQCYMSSFIGGNSGNRGFCKQPCRKKYSIESLNGSVLKKSAYNISLADLCLREDILKLKDAGVCSFKIEGRMRRSEYVASSIKFYKEILQNKINNDSLSDLKRCFNRGNYCKGYLSGIKDNIIYNKVQNHIGEFIGTVKSLNNYKAYILSIHRAVKGDGFKIIRDGLSVGSLLIKNSDSSDQGFYADYNGDVKLNDEVYITTDSVLNENLLNIKKSFKITINASFIIGKKAEITANFFNGNIVVYSKNELQEAMNSPLTENEFKNNLLKTDNYPFQIIFNLINLDNVFIPKSELNELRRELFQTIFYSLNPKKELQNQEISVFNSTMSDIIDKKTAIIASDFSFLNKVNIKFSKVIFFPYDYNNINEMEKFYKDSINYEGERYLYLPAFLNSLDFNIINNLKKYFDGYYCQGIYSFFQDGNSNIEEQNIFKNKKIFYGTGLNIFNKIDNNFLKNDNYVLSKELSIHQVDSLKNNNNYVFTMGNIESMQLIYCPLDNKCNICQQNNVFNLIDEDNRHFKVRRYKISDCRFIVYNCFDLLYTDIKVNKLFNFTLYDNDKIVEILDNLNDAYKLKTVLKEYTKGHFTKGIN